VQQQRELKWHGGTWVATTEVEVTIMGLNYRMRHCRICNRRTLHEIFSDYTWLEKVCTSCKRRTRGDVTKIRKPKQARKLRGEVP
jgi:hypothetical protein